MDRFESATPPLYNFGRSASPRTFIRLSQAEPNPTPAQPRRWSIVAAGLLLLALALVVLYTSRAAFQSPVALVVVAAIGLAALLLQLRLRKDLGGMIHAPLWLNAIGLLFAMGAVFADYLRLSTGVMAISALGAVICFGLSGTKVIHALRKRK